MTAIFIFQRHFPKLQQIIAEHECEWEIKEKFIASLKEITYATSGQP